MKFNQFTSIHKIIDEIKECMEYLENSISIETSSSEYLIIPKLNLVLRIDSKPSLFFAITKEFRSHQSPIMKILALGYIIFIGALLKFNLGRLFLNVVSMRGPVFYPAILGGNNRFRFIDSSNSIAILIARDTRSAFFTQNATSAYTNNFFSALNCIPEIFSVNDRVYFEKQIDGVAINRIFLDASQDNASRIFIDSVFETQKKFTRFISLKTFLRYKIATIKMYLTTSKLSEANRLLEQFILYCSYALENLGNIDIPVCPSHGDLNRGNVFINSKNLNIIDWEYFMYRYRPYDYIIFTPNLRHLDINEYKCFFKNSNELNFSSFIFLLEELAFRILNYKSDLPDSQMHIDALADIFSNYLVKFNE